MATTGRYDLLKKSVQCYINQTYPNKELVVLSQAKDNTEIRSWIESLGRDDIIFAEAPTNITLGEMRNTSIELSHGDIICQWDDDDLFHSDRIAYQYHLMMASSQFVGSCYTNFLKYFKQDGKMYWCDWWGEGAHRKFLCGAIMFYKKYYHIFDGYFYPEDGEQCHVEEDLNVLQKLMRHGEMACATKGHHYIYVYHGENTYGVDHHRLTLDVSSGKIVVDQKELLRRETLLRSAMQDMGVVDEVEFCDLRGSAFTCQP